MSVMIVVADTSPILYPVLIEHVELLQSLYGDLLIPEPVAAELNATKSPSSVRSRDACTALLGVEMYGLSHRSFISQAGSRSD